MKILKIICLSLTCLFFINANAQSVQQESYNNQEAVQQTPADYVYKCTMNENGKQFFVLANDDIMGYDANGQLVKLGSKVPPPSGRYEFMFMLQFVDITYAVDPDGHIWQKKYPFREIVGRLVKK